MCENIKERVSVCVCRVYISNLHIFCSYIHDLLLQLQGQFFCF
jgi:hypothetical protein